MSSVAITGRAARVTAPAGRPRRRRPAGPGGAFDLFGRPAEGQTLDEFLVGAWEDLTAHRTVTCPVCSADAMRPRYGSGQGAVGGRCGDCGTVMG